jgi:hypothetical protein
MKNRKFVTLYETIYNRYKQGSGFLEGDVVKVKSDYKSTEGYKSLTDSVRQRLEDASKSGYNIRVGRLHTPNANAGALGINVNLPATHADIYEEKTPGNFGNLMTVPVDVLEVHDTGVNLPPVSKNNKREASEAPYQKPGKWKANKDTAETKDQNHVGHEQNWVKNGDYELATKNKKSSVGANKYNDDKPSKFKDLPIRESAVMEGLLGAYQKVLTEEVEVDDEINDTGATAKALDHDDDITSEASGDIIINGKKVSPSSIEIEDMDPADYPDYSDAYVAYAEFVDGTPLSNDELEELDADRDTWFGMMFPENMAVSTGEVTEKLAGGNKPLVPGRVYAGELLIVDYGMSKHVKQPNAWYKFNGKGKPLTLIQRSKKPYGDYEETNPDYEGVDESQIEENMIKPDCWDKERNTVIDECWNEDGSMKEECWQGEAMAEDLEPGQAAGGVLQNPTERDDIETTAEGLKKKS